MEKPYFNEVIVVEGRYDANKLRQIVSSEVVVTDGFSIFSSPERIELLRKMADARGLIILTDSDGAGFLIRNRLKSLIPSQRLKHAYIPDIAGRERRKRKSSSAGLLGVEGVDDAVILAALRAAGAAENGRPEGITERELYADGLLGGRDSRARRDMLKARLGLPAGLSTKALIAAINAAAGAEEYKRAVAELSGE